MVMHVRRQADRQAGRYTGRQAERQTYMRQTDRLTDRHKSSIADRQKGRDGQTDRHQADR